MRTDGGHGPPYIIKMPARWQRVKEKETARCKSGGEEERDPPAQVRGLNNRVGNPARGMFGCLFRTHARVAWALGGWLERDGELAGAEGDGLEIAGVEIVRQAEQLDLVVADGESLGTGEKNLLGAAVVVGG